MRIVYRVRVFDPSGVNLIGLREFRQRPAAERFVVRHAGTRRIVDCFDADDANGERHGATQVFAANDPRHVDFDYGWDL